MDRPAKIAFIDIESTGLSHLSRPTEVAVILRQTKQIEVRELAVEEPGYLDGKTVDTEYLFQIDYTPRTLPEGTESFALDVQNWRDRCWGQGGIAYRESLIDQGVLTAHGPEWSIARSIHKLLEGATLVGVGVHYDAEVLGRMFLRHGLHWQPWHYAIRDLKSMADGYLRGTDPGAARDAAFKSESLSDAMGVDLSADHERHTALGDARWARRWFDAL